MRGVVLAGDPALEDGEIEDDDLSDIYRFIFLEIMTMG